MEFADIVLEFGLTRQEAAIYQTLLLHGDVTGYEAAKLTGISRSNTYNALAGLVDKGAAYVIEGQVTRYTPVPVKDFSTNKIRHLKTLSEQLITCAPKPVVESEGYVSRTIFLKVSLVLSLLGLTVKFCKRRIASAAESRKESGDYFR